jgi:hypothetical protein
MSRMRGIDAHIFRVVIRAAIATNPPIGITAGLHRIHTSVKKPMISASTDKQILITIVQFIFVNMMDNFVA